MYDIITKLYLIHVDCSWWFNCWVGGACDEFNVFEVFEVFVASGHDTFDVFDVECNWSFNWPGNVFD